MKWTTVAVFMACLAAGHCLSCEEAGDCNEGECCVASSINQIRGRGICRKLGRIGSSCNLEEKTLENYGGKYLTKCPCRSDFNCEPAPRYRDGNGNKNLADLSQRCRRPPTTKKPKTTASILTTGVTTDGATETGVTSDGATETGVTTDGATETGVTTEVANEGTTVEEPSTE